MEARSTRRLIAILLKIYIEMLLGCIIGDISVLDGDRVDGIACVVYARDFMEIVHAAVHGFEVRDVGLVNGHRVERGIGAEEECVAVAGVAHGQRKTVGVDLLVDEYGVVAIVAAGPDGERIRQRRYPSHEFIVGIHRVVEGAVNRGTGGNQENEKDW